MNNTSTVPEPLVVATPPPPLPTTFPTLSAEKGVEKKPETPLDNNDSFLLPILKFLNDSSTVPVQSSVATSPLPITFPPLNA